MRSRLCELEQAATVTFGTLDAMLASSGSPVCLAESVPTLVPALLRAAKMSHLVTTEACQSFIRLAHAIPRFSRSMTIVGLEA